MARRIIRKTARLASHYNAYWFVLYVQTPAESADRIPLATQRHLLNNFKLATELRAEVIQVKSDSIAQAMIDTVEAKRITTLCLGKPHLNLVQIILSTSVFSQLLKKMSASDVDIIVIS